MRPATAADVPVLREVERRAGRAFADAGLPEVAAAEPPSVEALEGHAADGRCAVAVDDDERPVGYVIVDRVDACAHVEQVSVDPDHQGQGIGRALMAWAEEWARADGRQGVTLTTFRDVPWNAPLYERLGYRVLPADEVGPGLMTVVSDEAAQGLDPAARVCMHKDLSPAPS
ncbi:GNAT family N-acetyltransferase [Iamia sp. SCSIO 61187]|uniref:GNAT family N-acetyltransferase n=1 Tax=Iamia sp. SCSIO 61187 TaxID=2722752 RepID=UPI001C62561F|nr:GNAT family N-acetyltransferase [Iamia sp. SCSIO 61187]